MASLKRDYYDVLGVGRDADETAIKKAFRRLARELHPDVSDDPDAEERFREVAEAYEVLSKPETRELYDRYGHDGLRRGGFRPTDFDLGGLSDIFSAFFGDELFGGAGRGRRRGADVVAEIEIDLVEAATGVTREVPLRVAATCGACRGSDAAPGSTPVACPQCNGAGRFQQISNTAFGQFVRAQVCPRCNGGGRIVTELCETCGGEGRVIEERALEVTVPPGIHDGQRLRLSGEGHAGTPGARTGDAFVVVHVRPDERFARDGDDLVSRIELTMTQAALGATVTVATLDGERAVELEPGTQPGSVLVLRGKGMPNLRSGARGDHRLLVDVVIPRRLTPEQRAVLESFERSATEATYQPEESLFDRIKGAFR